jgi:hypothetical protein
MGVAQTGFASAFAPSDLFSAFLTHVLPIWLFGALVGLLVSEWRSAIGSHAPAPPALASLFERSTPSPTACSCLSALRTAAAA